MSNCKQTNIPDLNIETEFCNGKYYSTFCIIHKAPLIPLGFPQGNANLAQILAAISNKIFIQGNEITSLQNEVISSQNEIVLLNQQISQMQTQIAYILAILS